MADNDRIVTWIVLLRHGCADEQRLRCCVYRKFVIGLTERLGTADDTAVRGIGRDELAGRLEFDARKEGNCNAIFGAIALEGPPYGVPGVGAPTGRTSDCMPYCLLTSSIIAR